MNMLLLLAGIVIVACYFLRKISNRLGIPTLLCFLALGMVFGVDGVFHINFSDYGLTEEICCAALIFIMFYGGFGTNMKVARTVAGKAILMSTLGTVGTAVLVAYFCVLVLGMDPYKAFLLGSVISSTDAASVFSILKSKQLGLKYHTASLLEMESGSNDPASYLMTIIAIEMINGEATTAGIVRSVLLEIGLGILLGVGFAMVTRWLFDRVNPEREGYDDLFISGIAILSYIVTVLLGGNGFLSVYITGVILGNSELRNKNTLVHFFDGTSSLMQMVLFFLLGLLATPSRLIGYVPVALAVAAFLTFVARPVVTAVLLAPLRCRLNQIALISFAGLRGAASIVFATLAAENVTGGDEIFHIVFIIVLFSILIQGTLLAPASYALDMVADNEDIRKTFTDYTEEMEVQFLRFRIPEGHGWVGQTFKDITLPPNTLAVLLERGQDKILPNGSTEIRAGDCIILTAGAQERIAALEAECLRERTIDADSRYCGKTLRELTLPAGDLVVLIKRGDEAIVPTGDARLMEGDVVVIISRSTLARTQQEQPRSWIDERARRAAEGRQKD